MVKMKKVIIWGASGHAKVIRPILREQGFYVVALIDRDRSVKSFIPDCPLFQSDEDLPFTANDDVSFAIAIGGACGRDRMQIHDRLSRRGFYPVTLVHPTAWVAETARLKSGAQVLGMAAVSEEAQIGMQSIINTNASVDHECIIGQGCHIMPGATIAGCVELQDFVTIGSNATIFPRVKIGQGAIIGAGSVITKDVTENTKVVGGRLTTVNESF